MAADFARTHAGSHPVLSDPTRSAFVAAGMKRGVFRVVHWRLLANLWRALRGGFRQGKVQGDPWQQGGVLVFGPTRDLVFEQRDSAAGDALALDAIVRAARQGA